MPFPKNILNGENWGALRPIAPKVQSNDDNVAMYLAMTGKKMTLTLALSHNVINRLKLHKNATVRFNRDYHVFDITADGEFAVSLRRIKSKDVGLIKIEPPKGYQVETPRHICEYEFQEHGGRLHLLVSVPEALKRQQI